MSPLSRLASMCLFVAASAHAQTPPLDAGLYKIHKEAGTQYMALITKAQAAHAPGIVTGDHGAALANMLADEKRFLKAGAYGEDEFRALLDLCSDTQDATSALFMFDSNVDIDKDTDAQMTAQATATIDRNFHTFSVPLSRMQPFNLRCLARVARTMESAGYGSPTQAPELRALTWKAVVAEREAALRQYDMVLEYAASPNAEDTMRASWIAAAAEAAPDLVRFLTPAMRKQLRENAQGHLPGLSERYVPYFKAVASAASDSHCGEMCQVPQP